MARPDQIPDYDDSHLPALHEGTAAELHAAMGTKPKHPAAAHGGRLASQTRLSARELRAIELTAAGATYEQVGKVIGITTRSAARQLVERALARRQLEVNSREHLAARALQMDRLEMLWRRWFPLAIGNPATGQEPDPRAAGVVLSLHDRIDRMLGLSGTPTTQVEITVNLSPEEEAERLTRVLAGLAEVARRHESIEGEFRAA